MDQIKDILASITHNPHYLSKYLTFISKCINKNAGYSGYTERHHICPKAHDLFPELSSFTEFPWNCVKLTKKQHLIAHKILVRVYPDSISMKAGLSIVLRGNQETSIGILKDTITVKDSTGRNFRVKKDDARFLSGELTGSTKGYVTVTDGSGNNLSVKLCDPRVLSGELVSVNKNKVPVRDAAGNTFQVSKNDPRYISGELSFVLKGKPAANRRLTKEQVLEIRNSVTNKSLLFSRDFLISVIHDKHHEFIGIKPLEELNLKNNTKASYDRLSCVYYAKKHNMQTNKIKDIILNNTYKDIIS